MSVRKRTWKTARGERKASWVVDYVDQRGVRRLKTFARKKEADRWAANTIVDIGQGTHVAETASPTVSVAAKTWLANGQAAGLERSTVDQYRQHLELHINPLIGRLRLSQLNVPTVREFEDALRTNGRSPAMVRKVLASLGSLLADAQERGLVARNVVRDVKVRRPRGKQRQSQRRLKGKLKVGLDIPTREEVRAVVANASGKWRPILITAIFSGLRASELRGLRWFDVDLAHSRLHVRQRADRYNKLGPPKSEASERTVPLPPIAVNVLRQWKKECPKSESDLVFPNGSGNVESLANIINRGLIPVQIASGVTKKTEKVRLAAKYTGMHALRHFYASWCINRKEDGGLGLPPKLVQERLGHSSIGMTMDVYGHLFPSANDREELEAAELALLAG